MMFLSVPLNKEAFVSDCIFCKIIAGEIPSYKIFENEFVYAFLDIAEDMDGHTLVVPKKHCRNILDCADDDLLHLMQSVKKITSHYISNCGYEGANIFSFTEACAGQTVFHLHFHVYPRTADDGFFTIKKEKRSKHSLEDMQKKLAFV
jgi:histidine triad (HIT) family protein